MNRLGVEEVVEAYIQTGMNPNPGTPNENNICGFLVCSENFVQQNPDHDSLDFVEKFSRKYIHGFMYGFDIQGYSCLPIEYLEYHNSDEFKTGVEDGRSAWIAAEKLIALRKEMENITVEKVLT